MTLPAPDGWTVQATSPATFDSVGAGQTVHTTWSVTAPAGATPGGLTLEAGATSDGGADRHADTPVSVPYASRSAALNNTGISDDADPSKANFDGGGLGYSAQALAAAGVSGTVQHGGLTFAWPATPGTHDNIVAGGQAIAMSGSGSKLGFLGSADFGAAAGTGTIVYTDGTTQQYALAYNDWWGSNAAPGTEVLATAHYMNTPTGKQTQDVSVYYASVPLAAGKTVRYLILPNISQGVNNGQIAMHIFSIATG